MYKIKSKKLIGKSIIMRKRSNKLKKKECVWDKYTGCLTFTSSR